MTHSALWWKRYEHILEAKPRAAAEVLVDLIGVECAELCANFPPPSGELSWVDQRLRAKMEARAGELTRPSPDLVDLVVKVLRWDLAHEDEAIDHLFRNDHHREVCASDDDVLTLHFLWRALMELLLLRKEEADGRLKRAHLVAAADKISANFRRL